MVGKRFEHLPEHALSVPASMFLAEWSRFLHVIVEGLIELNASLQNDESYVEYHSRLLAETARNDDQRLPELLPAGINA